DRLDRTLSRDRAKDMALDYKQIDPAQSYAERRGITFRKRMVEIVRRIVPEKLRDRIEGLLDGLRSPGDAESGRDRGFRPGREDVGAKSADVGSAPEKEASARGAQRETDAPVDAEAALRSARTKALVRHARALDTLQRTGNAGGQGSPEQMRELGDARSAFEKVRPHGWRDAEAAYAKSPELVHEAGTGRVNRIVLALQLETEIRTGLDIDPGRRADRFVERWQKLERTSQGQYQAGDMSGYKSTRSAMSDMTKSLERDPQLESLLANHKKALGIQVESGRRLGAELAFNHGIGLGRARGIGI
ncbi:Ti-type conjugative transfer relaxase TraA, partial [Mesorhizobium australicum]